MKPMVDSSIKDHGIKAIFTNPEHSVVLINGDHLEVTNETGRRFTFPIIELQATRRPLRSDTYALPCSGICLPCWQKRIPCSDCYGN